MGKNSQIMEMQKSIHELEHQVGQIASSQHARSVGALSTDIENNLK